MRKIAVLQSNYIPWRGYFDIIHDVDEFIFYDEVQYTKNDWRNRNKIYADTGVKWLTVPVLSSIHETIDETMIVQDNWRKKHLYTLQTYYGKAPYYHEYKDLLEYVYIEMQWEKLSELNQYLIQTIAREILGIQTVFSDSRSYASTGSGHHKLLDLLKKAGAEYYISGPAAKNYIIEKDYQEAGIQLCWKDYSGYPDYKQLHEPFQANVSILDLLFNVGKEAPYYIWGWRKSKK